MDTLAKALIRAFEAKRKRRIRYFIGFWCAALLFMGTMIFTTSGRAPEWFVMLVLISLGLFIAILLSVVFWHLAKDMAED